MADIKINIQDGSDANKRVSRASSEEDDATIFGDGSFTTEVLLSDDFIERAEDVGKLSDDTKITTTDTEKTPSRSYGSIPRVTDSTKLLESGSNGQMASLPPAMETEELISKIAERFKTDNQIRVHYYVKITVSALLCMLLLIIGVPVFMESRATGSISYTALGVVMVGFGLVLAVAVIVLLFRPPFDDRIPKP